MCIVPTKRESATVSLTSFPAPVADENRLSTPLCIEAPNLAAALLGYAGYSGYQTMASDQRLRQRGRLRGCTPLRRGGHY